MPRVTPTRARIDIHSDSSSSDEDHHHPSSHTKLPLNTTQSTVFRDLSIPQAQNRQSSAIASSAIVCITTDLKQFQQQVGVPTSESHQPVGHANWADKQKNSGGGRLSRPRITANTFEVLDTVPEDESQHGPSEAPPSSVSDAFLQDYPQLSVEEVSRHILSTAAREIKSAEEQLAKHRRGDFECVLETKIPILSNSKGEFASGPKALTIYQPVYLGCNLLPTPAQAGSDGQTQDRSAPAYTLLTTPLKVTDELIKMLEENSSGEEMVPPGSGDQHSTPIKQQDIYADKRPGKGTSQSATPTREDDSFAEVITSRSPAKPVARIEDSLEALDQLEEQLEAFDEAAHIEEVVSPEKPKSARKHKDSPKSAGTVRFATPQPKRNSMKPGSASVRVKPASEPRRGSLRRSNSMIFLDSPKMKTQDKSIAQAPPKKAAVKLPASLLPPKQPPKSTKLATKPTFELPGEAVARRLKEQRDARMTSQAAVERLSKPTASSLRRTKSARQLERPTFELPGEAISRRKREEHESRLKAQEEEEKKRREFKARPIGSGVVQASAPRGTLSSRARQNMATLAENPARQAAPSPNKRLSTATWSNGRSPLSDSKNQPQTRGRDSQPETSAAQARRAISSSAGSTSGKRSTLSTEKAHQQRQRGQEVYQRDNSLTGNREREKREHEALARLAREEAAERSRQQSREWAAKQAKKRMTVSSLRDVMT
ncbi:Uu.00g070950.m01.CDS01 [Anthostomella pinea]|uniref:Uu.00g070950.m01.CDS01 n=1 Tax=Anthostomella pinea TaxID=933095 RepID=A0AAI8VVF3_9PEZI|nr:Uu.00g070950.m01.CDS01 [Anthostomella pinea]